MEPIVQRTSDLDEAMQWGWDRMVSSVSYAPLFATLKWIAIIRDVYHLTPLLILIRRGSEFCAITGFTRKRIFASPSYISMPFNFYAPIVYSHEDLVPLAFEVLNDLPFERVVLNHALPPQLSKGIESHSVESYINLECSEPELKDRFSKGMYHDSLRRERRSAEQGVTFDFLKTEEELRSFYLLAVRFYQKRFAMIFHPESLFKRIFTDLIPNDQARIYTARYRSKIIAGLVILRATNSSHYAWGISDTEHYHLSLNKVLLRKAIIDAHSEGHISFNLGTTPLSNSNLLEYKRMWGGTSVPVMITCVKGHFELPNYERDVKVRLFGPLVRRIPAPMLKRILPYVVPHLVGI
ncbi:MAG: GNAT family N-acetyltransferase [Bdellovibrionota bacterium]|nr:MAG: GNAT family N-acetyltransferase [Bdellovibrionota bacterium]